MIRLEVTLVTWMALVPYEIVDSSPRSRHVIEDRLGTLEFAWNNQIVPLLEEYFYTQREKLAQLLAPFLAD